MGSSMISVRFIETPQGEAQKMQQHIPVELIRERGESIGSIIGKEAANLISEMSIPTHAELLQVTVSAQYIKVEEIT